MVGVSQDRRTREDLRVELAAAEQIASNADRRREEVEEAHKKRWDARDAEAVAIERCVQALQELNERDRSSRSGGIHLSSYGSSTSYYPSYSAPPVERALDYLRRRFGLPDPGLQVEELKRIATEQSERADRAESTLKSIRSQVGSRP